MGVTLREAVENHGLWVVPAAQGSIKLKIEHSHKIPILPVFLFTQCHKESSVFFSTFFQLAITSCWMMVSIVNQRPVMTDSHLLQKGGR